MVLRAKPSGNQATEANQLMQQLSEESAKLGAESSAKQTEVARLNGSFSSTLKWTREGKADTGKVAQRVESQTGQSRV